MEIALVSARIARPDHRHSPGENLSTTRRARAQGAIQADAPEVESAGVNGAAAAHAGMRDRLIDRFSPGEQAVLSPGKSFDRLDLVRSAQDNQQNGAVLRR